ncbi:MAG TPA: hypothetical protein VJN67_23330, partial [Stellaceae bacterium]|nr:hypothetical protein [Stellaceae bacterium]
MTVSTGREARSGGARATAKARRSPLFRDLLLTTTALVAALAGGGKPAAAGSAPANGLSGFNVVSGSATLSTP